MKPLFLPALAQSRPVLRCAGLALACAAAVGTASAALPGATLSAPHHARNEAVTEAAPPQRPAPFRLGRTLSAPQTEPAATAAAVPAAEAPSATEPPGEEVVRRWRAFTLPCNLTTGCP